MSAVATMLVWLAFAVLGYGVGRFHEQILASLPARRGDHPVPRTPVNRDRESRRYAAHRARRAKGLPCQHEWMDLPDDPPGYRAPCLFCDELKPLATDPEHAGKNKETEP